MEWNKEKLFKDPGIWEQGRERREGEEERPHSQEQFLGECQALVLQCVCFQNMAVNTKTREMKQKSLRKSAKSTAKGNQVPY